MRLRHVFVLTRTVLANFRSLSASAQRGGGRGGGGGGFHGGGGSGVIPWGRLWRRFPWRHGRVFPGGGFHGGSTLVSAADMMRGGYHTPWAERLSWRLRL